MGFEDRKRQYVRQRRDERAQYRREKAAVPPAPMTTAQARYLQALCERHDRVFDPDLSKREASVLIDELR